jgi:hypothetical protein
MRRQSSCTKRYVIDAVPACQDKGCGPAPAAAGVAGGAGAPMGRASTHVHECSSAAMRRFTPIRMITFDVKPSVGKPGL